MIDLDWKAVRVRLASIDDAEFIAKLRSAESARNFLSPSELSVESQIKFLESYLLRHEDGKDYYFIYSYKSVDFGVNRIYNVSKHFGTSGSWVCLEKTDIRLVLYTYYYMRKYFFETLKLKFDLMDTRVDNKNVLKLHKIFGAKHLGIIDEDSFEVVTLSDYRKSIGKFEKIIFG